MAFFTKRYHPPGTTLGTLTEAPSTEAAPLQIRLIDYCIEKITIHDNVDAVAIDQGFPVLGSFGLRLEEVEDQVLETAANDTLGKVHILKRELVLLRRMLWPQPEVINRLLRDYHSLVPKAPWSICATVTTTPFR